MRHIRIIFCCLAIAHMACAERPTIMLSPAGDANHTGRQLADGFERAAARELAEKLKNEIEHRDPNIRVLISHETGDPIDQDAKADFANRLGINFYLSIGSYPNERLSIDTFYRSTGALESSSGNALTFCPAGQAHVKHAAKTQSIAAKGFIPASMRAHFVCRAPIGAPIIAARGVNASACAIELGLTKMADILSFVEPLAQSLVEIAHES